MPIPSRVQAPILHELRNDSHHPPRTAALHLRLGTMLSSSIKTYCRKHKVDLDSIAMVAVQAPNLDSLKPNPAVFASPTWEEVVATETSITTCFSFSTQDCRVANPNIPPVPFVNMLLLRHPTKFRVCMHIGELTNITFIPASINDAFHPVISLDCGPGSLLINYAVRYLTSNQVDEDYDGSLGSQGQVHQDIVKRFLRTHDYSRRAPQVCIAREMFGDHDAQQLIDDCTLLNLSDTDTIATATRITAYNILDHYTRMSQHYFASAPPVDELFICGPSARNPNIVDYLEANLPEHIITKPLDDIGIPGDAIESVCYAHLGLETVLGHVTYAAASRNEQTRPKVAPLQPAHDIIRGKIVPGARWKELQEHIHGFWGGKPVYVSQDVRVARGVAAPITALDGG